MWKKDVLHAEEALGRLASTIGGVVVVAGDMPADAGLTCAGRTRLRLWKGLAEAGGGVAGRRRGSEGGMRDLAGGGGGGGGRVVGTCGCVDLLSVLAVAEEVIVLSTSSL